MALWILAGAIFGTPAIFVPLAWAVRTRHGRPWLWACCLGAAVVLTGLLEYRWSQLRLAAGLIAESGVVATEITMFGSVLLMSFAGASLVIERQVGIRADQRFHGRHLLKGIAGFLGGLFLALGLLLVYDATRLFG